MLNIRTTDKTKHLLQQAAAMLGTTVSGFLLSSAMEKAYELVQNQNHFMLDDDQWEKFCYELDRAPAKNRRLISLFAEAKLFKDE